MTFRDLEWAVWAEAKQVFNNPKLRLKDMLEWSTGDISPEDDSEVVETMPESKAKVCIKKVLDKRPS